jgi:hypothetical protein
MKRNNVQLKKWEAALDEKQKLAKQLKSAMAEEKIQVTRQNEFPDVIYIADTPEPADASIAPTID